MDKRAAEQYLDRLFASRTGHIAVAYKDQGQSWNERSFAWPSQKSALLGWAEIHKDANIFICPAIRKASDTRKKGDMQPSRWLWADVDWQSVPADRVADVKARIAELSTFTVASGSTDESGLANVHVYVELNEQVEHERFIKLNTGLRDYLYADNKQADNSLLRLPGTTNWKTTAGSPVRESPGFVPRLGVGGVSPRGLMKRRAFRDAKVPVDVDASDWSLVDVSSLGLPRRTMRLLEMTAKESLGRYGARNKAVYAAVKELHKKGLDADQIHSLMDKFPPALDKAADENGYDRHLDIDRCLARIRQAEDDIPSIEEQVNEVFEESDDAFEEVSAEEAESEDFNDRVKRVLLERSVRRAADMAEAAAGFTGPPDDVSWSLTNALTAPPRPVPYLIAGYEDGTITHKGLAGAKHNVVITAQYKTGKTVFVTGTLLRSLVDGQPFLGKYPVNVPEGGVVAGHWNCEMDPAEMLDDYIRPVGIENTDNLHVVNLRGYNVNILSDQGKAWAVNWLTTRAIKVWTIDSFARIARMAGVSEKDNDEVMALLMRLDEIKVEAGCDALFLITHTGRAEMEEGKERARGATAIDDWADARWIMVKEGDTRLLAVEGRSVSLASTALFFDKETMRYELGYGGRAEVKADGAVQMVVKVVRDNPGITQAELWKMLGAEPFKMGRRLVSHNVEEAESSGFIDVRKEPRPGGGRAVVRHYLAGFDQAGGGREEADRMKRATPQDIDMRGVRVRQGRRRT